MIGEFDDDTHFCLKCHLTVIGLDNYVAHRKAGCSKSVAVDPPKSPLPSQLLPPDESLCLKADDFFSSLELQSSSKKATTLSTSGKSFSGILTRSKTTAVIQASTGKEQPDQGQSKSGKNIWIGGQELKLGHGDNQSKLIKAVANLERRKEEPAKIDTYDESEEDSEEYDYDEEESSDDDEEHPPRNHTGGKWKPTSPVQWNRSTDWNAPPPSYTGGKWKPGSSKRMSSPSPTHTKGKWKPDKYDDDIPPPTFTGSKWIPTKKQDYNIPPPNYTKGKWKPKIDDDSPPPTHTKGKWKPKHEDYPSPDHTKGKWKPICDTNSEYSPPDHTKGKWKPIMDDSPKKKAKCVKEKKSISEINQPSPNCTSGKWLPTEEPAKKSEVKISDDSMFRKSSGTIQYWCRPCNRRLASKIVYERHLKSELHFKRTLHDTEFDDAENFIILKDKRNKKKPSHDDFKLENPQIKKRKRKKIFEKCAVCNSKVNKYQMGKHLISHYHCRRGDITSEASKKMILENTYEIVLGCPFQCSICKFYCNTQEYFLGHWLSEQHTKRDLEVEGYYYCSFCKYKSKDTHLMYQHLISDEHKEVISVINRSVPIVIKKMNPIQCLTCNQSFLLHIQLLKHCEQFNHLSSNVDEYKNNFSCCNMAFKSNIALQRHQKLIHKHQYFICNTCNLNFNNIEEVTNHRKSIEHRYAKSKGDASYQRKCGMCNTMFENFKELKDHLNSVHPEQKIKCPHCGENFTVAQELTTHLRTKSCKFDERKTKLGSLFCDKCLYTTNSDAELLYHKVLHDEPLVMYNEESSKKPVIQYRCPCCTKFFPKNSLLGHIRKHTAERPFVCTICQSSFVRRNNLKSHMKIHEKCLEDEPKKVSKAVSGERPYLCSTCGASFMKKSILQQHMTIHTGKNCKCTFPGCVYTARKKSEIDQHYASHSDVKAFTCNRCNYRGKTKPQLNRHMLIHSGEKKFQCPHCTFTTRISMHLKRHIRIHTGAKPFNCPHCYFKCNSLDNLRKHVLSTNKHPGKCIYECKFCADNHFQSNFAKEFKAHLVTEHSEMFGNGTKATSYVAGIYDVQDDSTSLNEAAMDVDGPDESGTREEHILRITSNDPIVAQICSADIPSSSVTRTSVRDLDEMLPLYVIPKDEIVFVENHGDTWNLVGRYDVEGESGTLVPFQNDDSDALFEDHF